MDNLEICRLCLKRDKELLNIFSDNIIEINVWEKIQKYLYLHIKAGGNLSKSICLDCLERIKHFDSFFKEVEANQIKYQKDFVVLCDKKSPEQSNTGTESKVCEPPAKWFKQEIKVEPEFQINSDHDNLPKTSLELASENCDVYNINVKSEHDNVELSYMVDNHSEEDTLSGLESGKNVLPVTFLQTNMELNLPNSSSFGSDKFPTNCEVEEHEKSHPRNKIDKRNRHVWTVDETRALLVCYFNRKDEFQRIRKKKRAYENIVKDLNSMSVLTSPVTFTNVENKIKYLFHAYKTNLERKNTVHSISIEPYADLMEDIFDQTLDHNNVSNSCINVKSTKQSVAMVNSKTATSGNSYRNSKTNKKVQIHQFKVTWARKKYQEARKFEK